MGERILVVEDERALRENLVRYLKQRGYEVDGAPDAETARKLVTEGRPSVMLTDLRLPGEDGLGLLRFVQETHPDAGVLVMTAYASVDSAVEALRAGAHDYLLKPLILDDLSRKIENLLRFRDLARENARLRQEVQARMEPGVIVGASAPIRNVREWIERAAASMSNVLITGESGTGKELVARAIHAGSVVRDRPFLAINVSAIPAELVESHLFGHERGAFTGASARREGVLRAAAGGTVFLDEIGELPLPVQAKLLRAIEEREFFPVGSDSPVKASVRIVSATHRDLEAMVERGAFRDDLYYRLNVVRIHVPPLRERPEDVPALAAHLLRKHAAEMGRRAPMIDPEALQVLMRYEWKGNVRELSNVLERALILCTGDRLTVENLPRDVASRAPAMPTPLKDAVSEFERRHIAWVLELAGGNRERAARLLGLSPATLYRRLDRLGLSRSRGPHPRDSHS